jgi:hypothetical protein
MLDRRTFMMGSTAAATLAWNARPVTAAAKRPRIAFLATEVRLHSHAQHFLDRHAMGYAWGGRWQEPAFDIASVFIDQQPAGDLSQQRLSKYSLKSYPTIAEALTLGSSKLAVDGVVLIGEHGDYPRNERGQKLYPRYPWFQQVTAVFRDSGRSVPVFNDKHLSTKWEECVEMVEQARELGFAFLAGSSLPVTWRLPAIDMPWGTPLSESVCVGYGGVDSYDFHALEVAQCMSERRAGGEVGITSVHALKGESLWNELAKAERASTRRLVTAAIARSHHLPVVDGYPSAPVSFEWARQAMPETIGYLIEHRDGFRTTMLLAPIRDFNYAGLRRDNGEIISCQMYLPMPNQSATTADFFNPLARHIESLMLTGRAPYPIERTLLTSGMVIGGVESLFRGQQLVPTPEMQVAYTAPQDSHFWRE